MIHWQDYNVLEKEDRVKDFMNQKFYEPKNFYLKKNDIEFKWQSWFEQEK